MTVGDGLILCSYTMFAIYCALAVRDTAKWYFTRRMRRELEEQRQVTTFLNSLRDVSH
jgi:hypothetical protein